jgi:CRISPR system Cascade subunit CasD
MATTILRLGSVLQAWPSAARLRYRTGSEAPLLSTMVGLISGMYGVVRGGRLPNSSGITGLAVRIDRPGQVLEDYHIITPLPKARYSWLSEGDQKKATFQVLKANGSFREDPVVTKRYYRQDAEALLMIEHEEDSDIAERAKNPMWQIFIGRKSCPPSWPFYLGTVTDNLESALGKFPTISKQEQVQCVMYDQPKILQAHNKKDFAQSPDGLGEFLMSSSHFITVSPPHVSQWQDLLREGSDVPS